MRLRESPDSVEDLELVKRSQRLLEKADKLDMVEHEGKKVPAFAADGKGSKDEKKKGMGMCPTCGEKKMDMEKGMCMKAGCGSMKADMKKGEQHKIQTINFNPETTQFMVETGGNTYHQQYSTNNSLLESEDVANKGASSSSVNLVSLNRNQNPHDNPAPGHQTEG